MQLIVFFLGVNQVFKIFLFYKLNKLSIEFKKKRKI